MTRTPGTLPPPRNLDARKLPLARVPGPLFRMHLAARPALHFGKARRFRFDDPDGRFGVLYAGRDAACAFAETFGAAILAGTIGMREIAARALTTIELSRPLALVDLAGSGHLARIGADARLFAGEHDAARAWSAALHAHPTRTDGILYPARHDPSRMACAVFDRCRKVLRAVSTVHLGDPGRAALLAELLETYGTGLSDDA